MTVRYCLHTMEPAVCGPSKPSLTPSLTRWEIPRDLKPRGEQWTVSLKSLNVLEGCSRGGMETERPASGVSLSSEKGAAWNTFLSDPIFFLFFLATLHRGLNPQPYRGIHTPTGEARSLLSGLSLCDSTVGTRVPSLVGELRPHVLCGDTKKKRKRNGNLQRSSQIRGAFWG